jgi:hypothetical protein
MAKTIHMPAGFDVGEYLQNCAFYPCSEMHGLPVEILPREIGLDRFFYVDHKVGLQELLERVANPGFKGYKLATTNHLNAKDVFDVSWAVIEEYGYENLPFPSDESHDPFVVLLKFERLPFFGAGHGPSQFELLFARCEAISAYHFAFANKKISPSCLVYVYPGPYFYEFPAMLCQEIHNNKAGLPDHLLIDEYSSNPDHGWFFDLLSEYQKIKKFKAGVRGMITLRRK